MRHEVLIGFSFLLVLWKPPDIKPNEWIRKKLEKAKTETIIAAGEPLYCTPALEEFYQCRSYEIAWSSQMANQLISTIEEADNEGLQPTDYHLLKLLELSFSPPHSALAKADYDLLLSDAFMLYTTHLLSGKVNPLTKQAKWKCSPTEGDPVAALQQALTHGDVYNAIQNLIPQQAAYQNLKAQLSTYRAIPSMEWGTLPEGPTLTLGMEYPRIQEIRQRLLVLGDLRETTVENPAYYDAQLFAAVQRFQQRHSLDDDGKIGPATRQALNISPQECIAQIEANMERWRWLPEDLGSYYITVNIPDYKLEVVQNGERVQSHKVIVGKPDRQTPVFSTKMEYLVFNPTWTVPPGILSADVLPHVRKDSSYLDKMNLTVLDRNGHVLNPAQVDWNNAVAESYTYRQKPGVDNALGTVKFMFPNGYHVYLHDTPSKALFNQKERAFSSGCIRVQDALALATCILNDSLNWSKQKIEKVVAEQKTVTVPLKVQPRVHIIYQTAWVDEKHGLQFRKDIYNRDNALMQQLQEKPPEIPRKQD